MRRHPFDAVSLVFGLVFAGIGVMYLVGGIDVADLVTRFWPAALVMLGLAMLFSARRPDEVAVAPPPPAWTAPAPTEPAAPIASTAVPARPVAPAAATGPPAGTVEPEPPTVEPVEPVSPTSPTVEPETEPRRFRESTE
jgi:hypothetical protein